MDINFNENKQHTLAATASISGTGLHTGIMVEMILHPAPINTGYFFKRSDIAGSEPIKQTVTTLQILAVVQLSKREL